LRKQILALKRMLANKTMEVDCGVVGLKPTYGRVSAAGVVPLSWPLDHLGPITRSTQDAALLLQAVASYDPQDIGSLDIPVPSYTASLSGATSALRLGMLRRHFYDELHPEILAVMTSALRDLQKLTSVQRELEAFEPNDIYPSIVDTSFNVLLAEAYAYHQEFVSKSPDLYQASTLKRIQNGSQISTTAYVNSRRKLDELRRSAHHLFETVDLLVTPTCAVPPFSIEDLLSDPNTMRAKELLMLRNTRPFNVLGLPTISVPCGFTARGLPVGIQFSAPPGGEAVVLRLAHAYEQATNWNKQKPILA
jgi:aspartyl-tRNA(Asn)/glutamyl-tRNA(Gln) amidotransferase subunit A